MRLINPVFIVCAPRSGSTLLQCMLGANKATFSLPETHYFCSVLPRLGLSPEATLDPNNLKTIFEILLSIIKLNLPDEIRSSTMEKCRQSSVNALDVFETVIDHYRPAHDTAGMLRLIEKTPGHISAMNQIRASYPSARFIHIVRDSRDVVSSMLIMPTAVSQSVLRYAGSWIECIQQAAAFENSAGGKILTMRYEDLIARPESALKEICQFLSLDYQPNMVSDFVAQSRRCVLPHETWKDEIQSGKINNKSGIWRQRIDQGQAWLIETETQKVLPLLKYVGEASPSNDEKQTAIKSEYQTLLNELRASEKNN